MGVDAEMLVRGVSHRRVGDEQLTEWSWQLARSVGAKRFLIGDGLPPAKYRDAYRAWHEAFNGHPLHAKYERLYREGDELNGFLKKRTAEQRAEGERLQAESRVLGDKIRADVGPHPQEMRTAIYRTESYYRDETSAAPGARYAGGDGSEVLAAGDECLLQVSLAGRYYGPGYERGDILAYCAVAEWLELNLRPCTVLYGGDSGGVSPFGERERRALRRHLYSPVGRAYFNYPDHRLPGEPEFPTPEPCGLCPGGQYCGNRYGWGAGYAAFSCAGCGKSVESRDGGATWHKPEDWEKRA